jgi:hypothetical protein
MDLSVSRGSLADIACLNVAMPIQTAPNGGLSVAWDNVVEAQLLAAEVVEVELPPRWKEEDAGRRDLVASQRTSPVDRAWSATGSGAVNGHYNRDRICRSLPVDKAKEFLRRE